MHETLIVAETRVNAVKERGSPRLQLAKLGDIL
jgi:hypothetical protein